MTSQTDVDLDAIRKKFPAKFSPSIIEAIARELRQRLIRGTTILDQYAGIGGGAVLAEMTDNEWVGSEIEPEFAACHPAILCGDSRRMSERPELAKYRGKIGVAATSPDYGNRFADQYLGSDDEKCRACMGLCGATDEDGSGGSVWVPCGRCEGSGKAKSSRAGYAIALGRKTTPGSGTRHQFGKAYRDLHLGVLNETIDMCTPGALLLYNVSSSIAGDRYRDVMEWWLTEIATRADVLALRAIPTPRLGFGANADARVPVEHLIVARTRQR